MSHDDRLDAEVKTCTKCGQAKPLGEFRAQRAQCRDCEREQQREYDKRPERQAAHRERERVRKENPEVREQANAVSRARNKRPEVRQRARERRQGKWADPAFREAEAARLRALQDALPPEAERARVARHHHRWQGRSLDTATRYGHQWTGPELELAARPDLTAAQVAKMTGRSWNAVRAARQKLRKDHRYISLAGIGRTVASSDR